MKLKQKIALSLAVLYAVSVIGFALSLHFCGGKLANVSAFNNEVSCKFCKEIPAEKLKKDFSDGILTIQLPDMLSKGIYYLNIESQTFNKIIKISKQ